MAKGWFSGGGEESLEELIAKKKYEKAIEMLRQRFQQGNRDPEMRLQLADILILAGKGREAAPILLGLADEMARAGFAEKAIVALKKVQAIDPRQPGIEERLAALMRVPAAAAAEPIEVLEPEEVSEFDIGFEVVERGAVPPVEPPPPPVTSRSGVIEMEEEFPVGGGMDEGTFDEQLRDFIQGAVLSPAAVTAIPAGATRSPLFAGLAQHELLALIRGLRLRTYEPGDMIVVEGEPGDSVFIVSSGVAKVYVRGTSGRNVRLREMAEGAFFGEISTLSGTGRTATVIAATRCEILELDHTTLNVLTKAHPTVAAVLRSAYSERAFSAEEERARRS